MSEVVANYEPFPAEEVEPVRARLQDPELRMKLVVKWIHNAVEDGYDKSSALTPAERAADIAGFAVLEYQGWTSIAEGEAWTTAIVSPSHIAEMIAGLDQGQAHG